MKWPGATWTMLDVPTFSPETCTYCEETFTQLAVTQDGKVGLQVRVVESTGISRTVWFTASSDSGATWSEPVLVAETSGAETQYNPESWIRDDPQQTANRAAYLAAHPEEAAALSADALIIGQRTDHIRFGGDYWAITANADGFVAMWLDHLNGYPQLWARQVEIA